MISRLFKRKKRLDSNNPTDRLAALDALTEAELQAEQPTLAEMACADGDALVRAATLARLTDPDLLDGLLNRAESNPALLDAVSQHIATLIDQGADLSLADHPAVFQARLANNPSTELIESVMLRGEPTLLLDVVLLASREHREILLSHEIFQHSATLQELEHRSRGHDKRTNRFARSRIEEIRRHRSTADRLALSADEKLTVLEKPIEVYSSQEVRKRQTLLDKLATELHQLDESNQALVRAGEVSSRLAELSQRHQKLESARQAEAVQQSDRESSTATEDPSAFQSMTQAFETLDESLAQGADFDGLATERQVLTTQWLALANQAPPTESQHAVFKRVSRRFQQLAEAHNRLQAAAFPDLDTAQLPDWASAEAPAETVWQRIDVLRREQARTEKLLTKLAWPDWAVSPQSLNDTRTTSAAAAEILHQSSEALSRLLQRIDGRLQDLDALIDQGELTRAKTEAGELRPLIQTLPRQQAQPVNRRLGQCSARLAELSDWQTFATSPKRQALCQAMAELADNPLPAKDQADRIKTLRADWNELGPIARAADHRQLEQFNELAEKAFEPCRAYFSEQADERSANLVARTQICETLTSYLASTDWPNADFKAAEQIMRTARQEWRRFHPVDRTPGKPVEERFESLQTELHDQIKAEWDRNIALKQQIVDDARALVDDDREVHDKVTQAKSLQQRWKSVGLTPRRPDQTLWREFRTACDAVFEAREDAQKSADESIRLNQQHGADLLDSFKQSLNGDTPTSPAQLRDFQGQFEELPRLPERLQRPLDREFSQLVHSAQQLLRDASAAAERARLDSLQDLDIQVSELEQRHRRGESVDFDAPDPLFAPRWAAVDDPVPLEALQRQVVAAEIAAELDSPEADHALRLTIQVELLNTGRGRQALLVEPDELLAQWCRVGPKDAAVDPLRQRFFQAIEKLSAG